MLEINYYCDSFKLNQTLNIKYKSNVHIISHLPFNAIKYSKFQWFASKNAFVHPLPSSTKVKKFIIGTTNSNKQPLKQLSRSNYYQIKNPNQINT